MFNLKTIGIICVVILIAVGALGVSYGAWSRNLNANATSVTIASPPAVATDPAASISASTASLNGHLSALAPGSAAVSVSFDYGPTSGYGNNIAASPASVTGIGGVNQFSSNLSGLTSGQTYHFRAKGVGFFTVYGLDQQFVPAAPAVNLHLNPVSGTYDTTNGGTTLSSSELASLATSDSNRYWTDGSWSSSYGSGEYLRFVFPRNFPAGKTIDSVSLTFEWQRQSSIDGARLSVSRNNGFSFTNYTITPLPNAGLDATVTLDLMNNFGINTAGELNALIVQFQATRSGSSGNRQTLHDWVQVNVTYH